jgi:L-alanine-DL-glutamate epimerase-like enolase superfamily enzyme
MIIGGDFINMTDMVEISKVKLRLKNRWTISRNSSTYKENVIVHLQKDGISAYGEAAPNIRYGEEADKSIEEIKKVEHLFRGDLFKFNSIKEEMDKLIIKQSCAKAAIDMAVMDWVAQSCNLPLYRYLGLDSSHVPLTSFSIGIDTADLIREKVRAAIDFPILKVKLGNENDEEIIRTIRGVTDKPIRVDANEGWKNREDAAKRIDFLMGQNIELIEQPMPAGMNEETAWLKERFDIPIIADESVMTAEDIPILQAAFDGINIKLMKSGGILEALKMIRFAQIFKLDIMLGCMIETSVAISAAAQLAPYARWVDLDGNLLISNDPYQGIAVNRGHLVYSDRPGLGIVKK